MRQGAVGKVRSGGNNASARKGAIREASALVLQRELRAFYARLSYKRVVALEDAVLLRPMPPDELLELLLGPEDAREAPEEARDAPARQPLGQGLELAEVLIAAAADFEKLYVGNLEEASKAARSILWALGAPEGAQERHLARLQYHHRLRQHHEQCRVDLRLLLVHPGESHWCAPPLERHVLEAGEADGVFSQALLPEGFGQVTRTAWSLRLQPACWCPSVVLAGSARCCAQTAERLRAVAANEDDEQARPEAQACEALDSGPFEPVGGGGRLYRVAEELGRAVAKLGMADTAPPPAVAVVATGATLEMLLACATAGGRREDAVCRRLGCGDAVLLQLHISRADNSSGHGGWFRSRSQAAVWEDALQQAPWAVQHHLVAAAPGRSAMG